MFICIYPCLLNSQTDINNLPIISATPQPNVTFNGTTDETVTVVTLTRFPDMNDTNLRRVADIPSSRRGAGAAAGIASGSGDSGERGTIDEDAITAATEEFLAYDWWHPRLIATGMFSLATVIAFLRMMPYTVISDSLGPLQISLGAMITRTTQFFLLLFVVTFSIAVGMTYVYSYHDAVNLYICANVEQQENCRAGDKSK